jgi:hypothetical protein
MGAKKNQLPKPPKPPGLKAAQSIVAKDEGQAGSRSVGLLLDSFERLADVKLERTTLCR